MNPSLKRRLVVISATAVTVIISIVVFLSYSKARAVLTENMTTGILPGKIQAATADLEKELETYRTIAVGMNGDLGEIIEALATADRAEKLRSAGTEI